MGEDFVHPNYSSRMGIVVVVFGRRDLKTELGSLLIVA